MDQKDQAFPPHDLSVDPRSPDFVEQFGSYLLANSHLDELAIKRAQRAQRQSGERFDLVLTRLGLLQDQAMARALATFCNLRLVSKAEFPLSAIQIAEIDPTYFKSHRILPISATDEALELAVADPFNSEAISALSYLTDRSVKIAVAPEGDLQLALEALYGAAGARGDGASEPGSAAGQPHDAANEDDVQRLEDMASEAPVIRLVQDLITRAVNEQASDIHIEPLEDCVKVRVRVDGLLLTIDTLPIAMRAAIGSRIKIMARLNIAERRLPQDGRIKVNVRGREIDLRVSTMPTLWGESIVLRILDRSSVELDFPKLGFEGQSYLDLTSLLSLPNGIILVTGPTGSGKTTTLYTALSMLNSSERKVFTVEDPIEYQLSGVNQIQVQPKIGLTFAAALRSILRQDPDIIMVGEIRDLETAQIAIQAALTGHLVLSTVHTNSASATLTRLLDMGVEKYLLASTVKGVLAQRLVRRLCPTCAAPSAEAPRLTTYLEQTGAKVDRLLKGHAPKPRRPVGCPSCRQTGFSGRTTIHELLTTTPEVTDAILEGLSESEIERTAMAQGMTTMLQGGLAKVLEGETTAEEVMRATRFDGWLDTDTRPTTSADL